MSFNWEKFFGWTSEEDLNERLIEAAKKNEAIKKGEIIDSKIIQPTQASESKPDKKDNGLLDSDLSEKIIKINDYKLKKGQYYSTSGKKEYVFLHFTAGWENPYNVVNDWNSDSRGAIGTQFVIGGRNAQTLSEKYDGEIVQCMTYKDYAWHLGIGNNQVHRNSIGIEICNWGPLNYIAGDYLTWANKSIKESEIVKLSKDFRGKRYFHKLTDEQLHSINFLLAKISKDTGIDITNGLKERIKKLGPWKAFDYDPTIKTGSQKGLFCHTNVSGPNRYGNYEKWDWWPQEELVDLINSL